MAGSGELVFTIADGHASPAVPVSLAEAGLRERDHLQEWVLAYPQLLGAELRIVSFEFDRWLTATGQPAADRLDVLALDRGGRLVVAELNRDRAPDTVSMQALNYAAMVSRFNLDTLTEVYAAHRGGAGVQLSTWNDWSTALRHHASHLVPGLAVLALVMIVVGCGSHPPAPPPSPASSTTSSLPPTTAAPSAADLRVAKAAILKLADVGVGYKPTPYRPTAQAAADDAALNRCIGRPPSLVHQTAKVFSSQFSRGDTQAILASITFVDTEQTAQEDLAALQGPSAMRCIKQSFLDQYQRANGSASVEIGPLSPSPTGRAPSANYRIKILAQTANGTLPLFLDLAQAIKGRAEVSATFLDVNQPVPLSVEQHAMAAMLGRL